MTEQTENEQTSHDQASHERADDGTSRDAWTDEPTGDGGALGTPSTDPGERGPSADEESHGVVSGGGVVEREDLGPTEATEAAQDLD